MKNTIITILAAVLIIGCKTNSFVPVPSQFKNHVKGLYMTCYVQGNSPVSGEIIEVKRKSLLLKPIENLEGMRKIDKKDIKRGVVLVALTNEDPKRIRSWGSWLGLSSLLHGYFLVFTLPINLSLSTMSNTDGSGAYRIEYPGQISWDHLYKFARFPQGIPSHITADMIK